MIKYNEQYMTTRFKKRFIQLHAYIYKHHKPKYTTIVSKFEIVENKEKMHIYGLHGGESESYFLA